MAVFRIEKTRDYTVMSNHHLRNKQLSLKAKGLLSLMLSLPDEWDYTTKGLARICKESVDCVCGGVSELEEQGYLIRERIRKSNGQLGSVEYTILEQPRQQEPKQEKPVQVNPILGSPILEEPEQEKPDQLNTKRVKKEITSTDSSNPIPSTSQKTEARIREDGMDAREAFRQIIMENIEYDRLWQDPKIDRECLQEITELIVDTVCSSRKTIRIASDDYPAEVVKSRFLRLDRSHVEYVVESMRENTTRIHNIKKYILAALYNAPITINSYYASLVQHDLYGKERRS